MKSPPCSGNWQRTTKRAIPVLDAGRGNPNWINAQTRYAFTRFMNFAIGECELDMNQGGMAGHGKLEGVGERFDASMNPDDPTDAFLIAAVDYCVNTLVSIDVSSTEEDGWDIPGSRIGQAGRPRRESLFPGEPLQPRLPCPCRKKR